MEIIIRSRENGWETERRMELPEDAGLVKSILRSVKRRVDPPKLAEFSTRRSLLAACSISCMRSRSS